MNKINWKELNNKTTFEKVYKILEKSNKPLFFDEIWNELKHDVIGNLNMDAKKMQKLELDKKTELYCLMTIAGDFFLNKKDQWDLEIKYDPKKLRSLKIKFNEEDEIAIS